MAGITVDAPSDILNHYPVKHIAVRLAALLSVLSCVTLAAVEIWPTAAAVKTVDQNRDGRPDRWTRFDARGQVTHVAVDTNFDGRPDVEEYYERGILVRRESDRNFNGQADLIEEFDAETHGQTRTIVDVDFDGTADLLVLFRDGRPIYSKRTSAKNSERARPVSRRDDPNHLAALTDPFAADLAVRAVRAQPDDRACVPLFSLSNCPRECLVLIGPSATSVRLLQATDSAGRRTPLLPRSPRAPPVV